MEEWPAIKAPRLTEILSSDYGYEGSLRLVQARLQQLRPSTVRPAQRTGYRPGQVLQLDWAEMPSRPMLAGRERRVWLTAQLRPFVRLPGDRWRTGSRRLGAIRPQERLDIFNPESDSSGPAPSRSPTP